MPDPIIYPAFRFKNASAMIEWLGKAFGFSVVARYETGGKVMHAELALGKAIIMCGDEKDDAYSTIIGRSGPHGGKSLYTAVDDVDALYLRAKAAGATIEQEVTERDYGSREFICRDPEGNIWSFGTYRPTV